METRVPNKYIYIYIYYLVFYSIIDVELMDAQSTFCVIFKYLLIKMKLKLFELVFINRIYHEKIHVI